MCVNSINPRSLHQLTTYFLNLALKKSLGVLDELECSQTLQFVYPVGANILELDIQTQVIIDVLRNLESIILDTGSEFPDMFLEVFFINPVEKQTEMNNN